MRVVVHVPEVTPSTGGGFTFVECLIEAIGRASRRHELVIVSRGGTVSVPGVESRVLEPGGPSFREVARELRAELVWFTTPSHEAVDAPYLATVWDLEHRNQPYFPEVSVSGWTWESRERLYASMLPRAAYVLTGTATGARQIVDAYRVPERRVVVAPLPTPTSGPPSDADVPLPFDTTTPFLFYPAQFWPHKNHVALLHGLKRLREEHGKDLSVVLTGVDKGNLAHVRASVEELGLGSHVTFLGFVDRDVVDALYRRAFAMVFPSFFGPDNLPPLEAFARGCPVVTADVAGVRDEFGDAALYFDPTDDDALARAVLALVDDPDARATLVARGKARPVWTADDYVGRVLGLVDAFAAVRRTWSPSVPYVHG
ncbi:MAG: glycosyltransferase family 1 protein [Polyangiaceae bacterium]